MIRIRVLRVVLSVACLSASSLLCGCDTSSDYYASRSEAEADQQFKKGWLPESLPMAAQNIRVERAIDVGFGEGVFRLPRDEAAAFRSHLLSYDGRKSPIQDQNEEIGVLLGEGGSGHMLRTDRSTWLFISSEADEEWRFFMWPVELEQQGQDQGSE